MVVFDHDLGLMAPGVAVRGVEVWELRCHSGRGEAEDQSDCENDLFHEFLLSVLAG